MDRGWHRTHSVDLPQNARADRAEGMNHVLDSLRVSAQAKSKRDSLALVSATEEYHADSARIAQERSRSRVEARVASQQAKDLSESLRASLDLGQTATLDSLEAAHRAEIAAKDAEIAQADSMTASVNSLLIATELALASERASRQTTLVEVVSLQEEVRSLRSARMWDRFQKYGLAGAVVAVALITLR